MNSDLFTLKTLADELNAALAGARIDKIQQPEVDELRFSVRNEGKNMCLCISCNAGAPRINITVSKKNSPMTAPPFCMLLRKHLSSAYIKSVSVFNNDRILQIKFVGRTEMRDEATFYIFAEIMNRYSNIVFTDENLVILEAVKHLPLDIERTHVVLHGIKYQPVIQPKTSYLTASIDFLNNFSGGDLHKYILDNISGFSGITVSEIIKRSMLNNQQDNLSSEEIQRLYGTILSFRNVYTNGLFSPCVVGNKEVYPLPYSVLDAEVKGFDTLSAAYDELLNESDGEIRNKARLKSFVAAIKRLKQRTEKNIALDKERLHECENMDRYRILGELIVSNIYKIKRGDKNLKCVNYYDNSEIEIPLDEQLTPSKNSAQYYNKYNKLKRTKDFTEKKLNEDELLLSYVCSVEEELNSLSFDASASAIEEELILLGAIRKKQVKGKIRKEKPEPPFTYFYNGFTVLRGKNNLQNDELTFKIASSNDIWLHVKNFHSNHTVILTEGRTVPDDVLKFASEIAACAHKASVDVDYTERRNVKRQPNGHPGQVIYVNFKTLHAAPNQHAEFLKN